MICIRYKEALSSPAPPSPEEEIDRGDRSYFHYITPFGRSVGRSLVRPSSRAVARNRADICLLSLSLSLSLSLRIYNTAKDSFLSSIRRPHSSELPSCMAAV